MVPKFRGWDRKNHVMYDFMMMCFNVNLKNVLYRNKLTDFDVDMYTGLKDANGKEVYEDDILATSSRIGGKLITDYLKVDWREDYAGFFCGETPLYACLSEWDNDIKYPQTFPEIVGNVHENPELLEAQHD
ncbi:YopX family protein [Levilactobacillus brevis]|uniref:YopX family protein n=1 Tax=Levilactobacillus brevis TaxID=1580 RepID=UPI000847F98E|nr:YopX family protein [Levilactobacillus brevis]ODP93289.1 hypothetical protein BGC39_02285 [Levilactobacillus brevis]